MNESLVTNLDLSQRLAKLGVPQKSQWYWDKLSIDKDEWCLRIDYNNTDWMTKNKVSAFLCSELLEMLPAVIKKGKKVYTLRTYKIENMGDGEYCCQYHNPDKILGQNVFSFTPAQACGLMLEYLIKNKLVKRERRSDEI